MTHFIWISGGYVATLVDELKHVLSGGSETTARKFHATTAENQSRPQCVLQQLHETNRVKTIHIFILSLWQEREN